MNRKTIVTFLILLFLISLFLPSCVPKSGCNVETGSANILIEDVPSAEELKSWKRDDITKLKLQIEQIPLSSCEEYFTKEITAFLSTYENADLENLTIQKDNLSVVEGQNKKSLRNLEFEVQLLIDTTGHVGSDKFPKAISEELLDFLEQYSYFNLKAKMIRINHFDSYHNNFYHVDASFSGNETVFAEQPKDEYAVQTLAFLFSEKKPAFRLRKFGFIPETKELYAEYSVNDDYFDYSHLEDSIHDLEQIGTEIKEYLLSQKVTETYVLSNGAALLTVSFYNGVMEENPAFSFELFHRHYSTCFVPRERHNCMAHNKVCF